MDEQLLIRAAQEAPWAPTLDPAEVIRTRGRRRRRVRRVGISAAIIALAGIAYGAFPGQQPPTVIDAPVNQTEEVGPVLLTDLPDAWRVAEQPSTSGEVRACAGPTSNPCAILVIAASTPARNSGIDWFSALTSRCLSPKSTTVLSTAIEVNAGPAQEYSLKCDDGAGTITNTAWVLDAGVAVIPASEEVGEGRRIAEGIRFVGGRPNLPPPEPSEEPTAERY